MSVTPLACAISLTHVSYSIARIWLKLVLLLHKLPLSRPDAGMLLLLLQLMAPQLLPVAAAVAAPT